MNAKLIDSLVQIINSLTAEERKLLEEKLHDSPNSQENLQKMQELGDKISARREGKPLEPRVDEIIHQMRDERTQQLMQACCPGTEDKLLLA
jgi:hypothetical protein